MFSIYTSAFNLKTGIYNWEKSLSEFSAFANEVVVATFNKQEDIDLLKTFSAGNQKIKIVVCDLSLDDPEFDGKLKNAALQNCTKPYCILLDLDERILLSQYQSWANLALQLGESEYDSVFIPVIDLFHSESECKDVGFKWYLHKNFIGLERGVVNFARKVNGKIDTDRSDSTELVRSGELAKTCYLFDPRLSLEEKLLATKKFGVYVYHYGWLDSIKKELTVKFWEPVWSNRAGRDIKTFIDYNSIKYYKHNLE